MRTTNEERCHRKKRMRKLRSSRFGKTVIDGEVPLLDDQLKNGNVKGRKRSRGERMRGDEEEKRKMRRGGRKIKERR